MVDYVIALKLVNNASRGLANVEKQMERTSASANRLQNQVRKVSTALAGFGAGIVIRGIARQYQEFERYRAVLTTFLGSQEAANSKIKELIGFANQLPQTLDDVVNAFTILQSRGIDTTAESLEAFSDIAAGNSKTLTQLAEALADALTGEFERLKEFGIKVSRENGKIVARIGDDIVAVSNTAKGLTEELTKLGQEGGFFNNAASNFAGTLTLALSNLQGAVFNLSIALGEAFSPLIIPVINALADVVNWAAENMQRLLSYAAAAALLFGGRFAVALGVTAVAAVGRMIASLAVLRGALIRTGIGILVVLVGELIFQIVKFVEASGSMGEALRNVGAVGVEIVGRLQEAWKLLGEFMGDLASLIESYFLIAFGNILSKAGSLVTSFRDSLGPVGQQVIDSLGFDPAALEARGAEMIKSGQGFVGIWGELMDSYAATSAEILRPLESWPRLEEQLESVNDTTKTTTETTDELTKSIGKIAPKVDEAKTYLEEFQDLAKSLGQTLTTDLATALRTGEGLWESFGNFFTGMLDQIIAKILEVAFVQPILDSLFGVAGSGGGGILGSVLGIPFAGGRATGGPIPGGQFALVGEQGPELISGPGTVYSNSDSRDMLGGSGGGVVYAPVFQTTVNPSEDTSPAQAEEFARNFNNAIEAKVTDTIIKLQNRGSGGGFMAARSY